MRPRDLISLGASPSYFSHLAQMGFFEKSARGLYTLREYEVTENHGLVEAVLAQPKGVICLLSALNFHGVGTQIPNKIWVAVPYGSRIAKAGEAFARPVIMRSPSYDAGIHEHKLEGVVVPVYNVAKTVADCFKFRNKIGLDVALEALRESLHESRCTREEIREYAAINRVENVMMPYIEAMTT